MSWRSPRPAALRLRRGYLEKSIGRTGLLALKPVLRESARHVWQLYFLEEAGAGARPA